MIINEVLTSRVCTEVCSSIYWSPSEGKFLKHGESENKFQETIIKKIKTLAREAGGERATVVMWIGHWAGSQSQLGP